MNIDITKLFDPEIARKHRSLQTWHDFVYQKTKKTLHFDIAADHKKWNVALKFFNKFQLAHYDASTVIAQIYQDYYQLSNKEFHAILETLEAQELRYFASKKVFEVLYTTEHKFDISFYQYKQNKQSLSSIIQYHFKTPPVPKDIHPIEYLLQHRASLSRKEQNLISNLIDVVPYHIVTSPEFQKYQWRPYTLSAPNSTDIDEIEACVVSELNDSFYYTMDNDVKYNNVYLAAREGVYHDIVYKEEFQPLVIQQWKNKELTDEHLKQYFYHCPLVLWNIETMTDDILALLNITKENIAMKELIPNGTVRDLTGSEHNNISEIPLII